jgi:hypothetical protein
MLLLSTMPKKFCDWRAVLLCAAGVGFGWKSKTSASSMAKSSQLSSSLRPGSRNAVPRRAGRRRSRLHLRLVFAAPPVMMSTSLDNEKEGSRQADYQLFHCNSGRHGM